jgi:hypothetical protein
METLELAMTDDVDASALMKACKVDLGAPKEKLTNYIDKDLKTNVINDGREPNSLLAFSALFSAPHYAEGRCRPNRTGESFLWRYSPRQRAQRRGFKPSRVDHDRFGSQD